MHRLRGRTARTARASEHVVVRLSGEITAKNAESISKDLLDALVTHPRVLEVDLQRVTYMNSDGGRAFLSTLRQARLHGTRIIVTHTSTNASITFQRLGLTQLLDIHEEGAPENGTPDGQSP
ncbi:STAS domain-containing protein [Streptomyces sp. NPDC048665]|uniref:STAS domain-containing protein n=1 Tax=Streptomyces sp. NPDC048665 TaxID=3155490 RepID=UPI00342F36A2